MANLFERIKSEVSIVPWVESDTGSRAQTVGSHVRINPCPFCDHKDCFTLFPVAKADHPMNTFRCFSCNEMGSLIDYVMRRRGISEPLEAAKLIAEQAGIREEGREKRSKDQGVNAQERPKHKSTATPAITPERAAEVRRRAAEFYHGELCNTPEAWTYQTTHRRHSPGILSQFQIGFASGASLIKDAAQAGITADELVAVGLAKKSGEGYRAYIPKGAYVYPHLFDGNVAYFTIKRRKEEKPFQVPKAFAAYGWICFNQDSLTSSKCVIVEGENDLLAIADKARFSNVVATIGNYNTTNILAFLERNSVDRDYYLCFDNDPPNILTGKRAGEEYSKKYFAAIHKGGGRAHIIKLPEGVKDIDNYLREVPDPEAAFRDLMASAEGPAELPPYSAAEAEQPPTDLLSRFKNFVVLGELDRARVVFYRTDLKKIDIIDKPTELNLDRFSLIAGGEITGLVVRDKKAAEEDPDKIHFHALKHALMQAARKTQLGKERWLGQGVHLLKDGQLMIVIGNEVFIYDGYHVAPYDNAIIDSKFIHRSSDAAWINPDLLKARIGEMNKATGGTIVTKLLEIIEQWRFTSHHSALIVTGFILAQLVESVWDWRPHMWLTGQRNSGKTVLLELIGHIAGALGRKLEGATLTEAAFRQTLKDDFFIATIDEIEKSDHRKSIIMMLRSSNWGGVITKGQPDQTAIEFVLKHMVVFGSIETGLTQAAEKGRFIRIDHVFDETCNPQMPNSAALETMRIDLFAFVIWAALQCKKLVREIGRLSGYEKRIVECYAVPLSMHALIDDDPMDTLKIYLNMILSSEEQQIVEKLPEDHERLMQAILDSMVDVRIEDGGDHRANVKRSVHWCLNSNDMFILDDLADKGGIWELKDGAMFFYPQQISRYLLKDTDWKQTTISDVLRRIPGGKEIQAKRAGNRYRGIKLPADEVSRSGKDDD